jgi:hypothetical protein
LLSRNREFFAADREPMSRNTDSRRVIRENAFFGASLVTRASFYAFHLAGERSVWSVSADQREPVMTRATSESDLYRLLLSYRHSHGSFSCAQAVILRASDIVPFRRTEGDVKANRGSDPEKPARHVAGGVGLTANERLWLAAGQWLAVRDLPPQ